MYDKFNNFYTKKRCMLKNTIFFNQVILFRRRQVLTNFRVFQTNSSDSLDLAVTKLLIFHVVHKYLQITIRDLKFSDILKYTKCTINNNNSFNPRCVLDQHITIQQSSSYYFLYYYRHIYLKIVQTIIINNNDNYDHNTPKNSKKL